MHPLHSMMMTHLICPLYLLFCLISIGDSLEIRSDLPSNKKNVQVIPAGLVDQHPSRDCKGPVLSGPFKATTFQCFKLCTETSGCSSFQFYRTSKMCFLKKKACSIGSLKVILTGDYFIMRKEKLPRTKLFAQRDCYGRNIGSEIEIFTSRRACFDRCSVLRGCKSFSVDLTTGACYPKTYVCQKMELRTVGYMEYYVV